MRIISLLLLLTLALSSNGQTKNPFLSLKFDKVIMYDYQPLGEDPSLVDKKGQLITTVKIKKQIQVDTATINTFNKKVGDKKSYGQVTAMCFDPHLGIVYYLKGKIVRHILVCMDCNALRSDIDIPAQHQDKQGQGDKPYYLGDGMSKSFRQFLNALLIKYNFSHQIKDGSMFDK
ncbi:hypothetical protein [Lacibacter sp.]|uniref:hypothetical protein n=1 Tax=Lacibacter sp. TaxID=1915409 RepID=UPI002B4B454F|nr:hypothetical protein [Lacibacter sp.]HLP35644.1 hypothetical protein [Lacibacter sp.]